jgi:hypothetical protein
MADAYASQKVGAGHRLQTNTVWLQIEFGEITRGHTLWELGTVVAPDAMCGFPLVGCGYSR